MKFALKQVTTLFNLAHTKKEKFKLKSHRIPFSTSHWAKLTNTN